MARVTLSRPEYPIYNVEIRGPGMQSRQSEISRRAFLQLAAPALLMTEQSFRKIMGYRDLRMLKAALDRSTVLVEQEVA